MTNGAFLMMIFCFLFFFGGFILLILRLQKVSKAQQDVE